MEVHRSDAGEAGTGWEGERHLYQRQAGSTEEGQEGGFKALSPILAGHGDDRYALCQSCAIHKTTMTD